MTLIPDQAIGRAEEAARVRQALTERLAEMVAWPVTRIPAHERQLVGEVLIGLLKSSPVDVRQRCARQLTPVVDAPKVVLRYLARDELQVAAPLLESAVALDDADLIATIHASGPAHWQLIAKRRNLSETVGDALLHVADIAALQALLRNTTARISSSGMDFLVRKSRAARDLVELLLRREELKAAQGLTLFWWARGPERVRLLRRFAVDRATVIGELRDLFAIAHQVSAFDPDLRKTIQFIERRQRSRIALERSPYASVEAAIDTAGQTGLTTALVHEISHLCGIRPTAGVRILADPGGEAVAVLAKAIGLKRARFEALWSLARPKTETATAREAAWQHGAMVYDLLANANAQTVLRYWNWGISADPPPEGGADGAEDEFFPARRFAKAVAAMRF